MEIVNEIRGKGYRSAIIMMSAFAREFQPLIDEALKEKAQSFIEKPFKMNTIVELLGAITRKRLQEALG